MVKGVKISVTIKAHDNTTKKLKKARREMLIFKIQLKLSKIIRIMKKLINKEGK